MRRAADRRDARRPARPPAPRDGALPGRRAAGGRVELVGPERRGADGDAARGGLRPRRRRPPRAACVPVRPRRLPAAARTAVPGAAGPRDAARAPRCVTSRAPRRTLDPARAVSNTCRDPRARRGRPDACAARDRDDTRPRAGLDRGARRPVGLAHARADLAGERCRPADRGRGLHARDVRERRARAPAGRRCATARGSGSATPELAVERRRDARGGPHDRRAGEARR